MIMETNVTPLTIVVWHESCYAFTVMLEHLYLVVLWKNIMMFITLAKIVLYNDLFAHVMRF
jgi:hypothetical protein